MSLNADRRLIASLSYGGVENKSSAKTKKRSSTRSRIEDEKPKGHYYLNIFFFCDTKGNTRYMISGKVLVVGVSGEYPCSLTDDQIKRFDRVFRSTVLYFRMQDERNDSNAKSEPPKQKKRKEDNRHERIGC